MNKLNELRKRVITINAAFLDMEEACRKRNNREFRRNCETLREFAVYAANEAGEILNNIDNH